MGPDNRIVFSDVAIDKKTAKSLVSAVTEFEKVTPKNYHPGSNNLVVDLVHPSLFHLQYGRTKIFRDGTLSIVEKLRISRTVSSLLGEISSGYQRS